MSRQTARQSAIKLVYEYTVLHEKNELTFKKLTANESASDTEFASLLYNGVVEHFDELKAIIAEYSVGFTTERIYNMDLSVLLVALFEIIYVEEVPPLVSISEAVTMCKEYSTEKSHVFVNGILNSYVKKNNLA